MDPLTEAKHRLIKTDLLDMIEDVGIRVLCQLLAECCTDREPLSGDAAHVEECRYACAVINKAASALPAEKGE